MAGGSAAGGAAVVGATRVLENGAVVTTLECASAAGGCAEPAQRLSGHCLPCALALDNRSLQEWLVAHIMKMDKQYGPYMK